MKRAILISLLCLGLMDCKGTSRVVSTTSTPEPEETPLVRVTLPPSPVQEIVFSDDAKAEELLEDYSEGSFDEDASMGPKLLKLSS